jgi:hypothetical protein
MGEEMRDMLPNISRDFSTHPTQPGGGTSTSDPNNSNFKFENQFDHKLFSKTSVKGGNIG